MVEESIIGKHLYQNFMI